MHSRPDILLSDEELVSRAGRGCAESFDELMRRFQVPVLHFLRHRASPSDAEDLLQDTFVRVYENLHRYSPRWKFATWLFTIARRVSMNGRRKRRLPATADYGDAPANTRSPLENLMEKDDRRYLWEVARRVLSEPEQTALWLHYVEEMPLADIAIVLGRSSAAVKTAMFRARKRLLPHLKVLGPADAAVRGSDARVEDANSWAAPLEARHA